MTWLLVWLLVSLPVAVLVGSCLRDPTEAARLRPSADATPTGGEVLGARVGPRAGGTGR